MTRTLCAALCAALLALGWLYNGASRELAAAKTSLASALAVNEANNAAVERLERGLENTEKTLAGWNEDRTTLAAVRNATRQAIREAMRDETFKAWASAPAPAAAWRLLRETPDADANGSSDSSGGAAGRLPGNSDSAKRQ